MRDSVRRPIRIAAYDLALGRTGVAGGGLDAKLESLVPRHGADEPDLRLLWFFGEFSRRLRWERPHVVVAEGPAFGVAGKKTVFALGQQQAALRLAAAEVGSIFVVIPPSSLKKYATGNGKASKDEMIAAAEDIGLLPANDDEADAGLLRAMTRDAYSKEISVRHFQVAREAIESLDWPTVQRGDGRPRKADRPA